jgi:hypothetical protein
VSSTWASMPVEHKPAGRQLASSSPAPTWSGSTERPLLARTAVTAPVSARAAAETIQMRSRRSRSASSTVAATASTVTSSAVPRSFQTPER